MARFIPGEGYHAPGWVILPEGHQPVNSATLSTGLVRLCLHPVLLLDMDMHAIAFSLRAHRVHA